MAVISDIVSVSVTRNTSFPDQQGFGTPLILAYHTLYADRVRYYKSTKEVSDGGFAITSEAYRLASLAFNSNPRLSQIAIGRKAAPTAKTVRIFPQTAVTGTVYSFTVVDKTQATFPITYTVPGASTVASICTAIAALVDALLNVAATATATYVEITGQAAGDFFRLTELPGPSSIVRGAMKVADTSADPGLAADLTAIESVDATGWFMVASESNSEAEVNAIAAWVQSRDKMAGCLTSDSDAIDNAITVDVLSDLKTASYDHTFTMYYGAATDSGAHIAWMGKKLPADLDTTSTTWENAALSGVAFDYTLTSTHETVLKNKNGAYYTGIASLGNTFNSKVAMGEWIDVIHESLWLAARIQTAVYQPIWAASNAGRKIPFTDEGVLVIKGAALSVIKVAVNKGFLKSDPAPIVTTPPVADSTPADKAARHYRTIVIDAKLAGAIHKTTFLINLSL